jgi:large subunit ribosomal protein L21
MYAVIQAGGHQYRVVQGESLVIDRLEGKAGDKVVFDRVLMLGGETPVFGAPTVANAAVHAVIKEQKRNPKILVFKYKRRKNHKKSYGHAQPVTVIEIETIQA